MIRGHGGEIYHLAEELGCSPEEILDFSSNVSPLPPPEELYHILRERLTEIETLPEADSFRLRRVLSHRFGLPPENFFPSSGTTEWIFALPSLLRPSRILILGPTYGDYQDAAQRAEIPVTFLLAREEEDFRPPLEELRENLSPGNLVFLCNPNNPTGHLIPSKDLLSLLKDYPEVIFVVDESYLPFTRGRSLLTTKPFPSNLVVLFSFSKIYRIPGLRLGLAAAGEPLRETLARHEIPWAVNRLAQIAGEFLLNCQEYEEKVRLLVAQERQRIAERLKRLGCRIFPSQTNFLLLKLPPPLSGQTLRDHLLQNYRLLLRACNNFYGLDDSFVRIALRKEEENDRLVKALEETFRDLS